MKERLNAPNTHYNNVLSAIPNIVVANPRIVDLALLGSHDSFTHLISKKSKVAERAPKIVRFVSGTLLKNFTARYAKTQLVGAYEQLLAGVRYFDVRLHYANNTFMTKHFLESGLFADYVRDILKFLAENKGEVVVFRFYNSKYRDIGQPYLINFLKKVKYNGKSLLDYLHYKTRDAGHFDTAGLTKTPYDAEAINLLIDYDKSQGIYLTDLTYNDVTKNGTESGIVMYGWERNDGEIPPYFYADGRERAKWLKTSVVKEIFSQLENEVDNIKLHYNDITRHMFRVNQANLTMGTRTIRQIFHTIKGHSLIGMASKFNPIFIDHTNFDKYLDAMPCVWVDYATCNINDFNNKINQKLIAFNTKLCQ